MKNLILISLFLFSSLSIAQEISDLNGLETQSGRTYLFYRAGEPTPYNSIYKLDTETLQDTLFLLGYYSLPPFCDSRKANNDFEFFPDDSVNFMSVGNEFSTSFYGKIFRNDSLIISVPFDVIKIDISKQNPQKIFAGADNNQLFRSFDGGYTFLMDSVLQFTFLSLSPFNDNILFGLDSLNRLIKSFDGGHNTILVDTSKTDEIFNSKFLYDSDQQHIFRTALSYDKYIFWTSDNNGNQFSWTKSFESDFPILITNDPSASGTIYLANLKHIYKSTDFGLTFSLYKTFENRITGIYKKPNSDIIYASTKYKIYKITSDTVTVVKYFQVSPEILSFYPLQIDNKWIYDKTTVSFDPYQISFDTVIKRVIGDSVAANNKNYFVIEERFISGFTMYSLERIDTLTGKVYRYSENVPDNEFLIDDLTADVGDTIPSFRIGYWMQDGYTIMREITNFTKWGLSNKRKIFETHNLEMPVYALTERIGLDSSYFVFDFGYTTNVLRGCVIDGVAFGDTVVSVDDDNLLISDFVLFQNYPNPFNPTTKIRFVVPNAANTLNDFSSHTFSNSNTIVTLKVYDVLGNEVAILVNDYKTAGVYEVTFDASKFSSGVYFYRLKAGNFIDTKKMILIR